MPNTKKERPRFKLSDYEDVLIIIACVLLLLIVLVMLFMPFGKGDIHDNTGG